jgi:ADP-heptose:LPS heptosyltransferase
VDRWVEVARWLRAGGNEVVVTGSAPEGDLCEQICAAAGVRNLAGSLTLPALADLVADAGLLICSDTGVAHLATAYATPSVLLFGPTPPARWGPAIDPHLHRVLWHGHQDRLGDPHGSRVDPALASITVTEVIDAVAGLAHSVAGLASSAGQVIAAVD